ncbi:MAG: hypothetical protein J5830_02925 [Clostridia bacterium]|nr:hypothetical protein [Clostridia bacterium]
MTEQSVKRKITGSFAVKKRIAIAACFVIPAALLAAGMLIKDFAVLIAFIVIIAAAVPFEIFFIRFLFRVEYDYSLVGDALSVSKIRDSRYGKTVAEINLHEAESFSPYRGKRESGFRRVEFCGDDEQSDALWEIIYREPEAALPDLIIFSPDERLVKEIKKYVR